MKKLFFILFISLLGASLAVAQTASPTVAPTIQEDEDVVKISTALIQLDVVVTDKSGKLVTDLKPEDFEITENGERQTITNLAYFTGRADAPDNGSLSAAVNNNAATMPTVGEVRRTVAVVIDDAGLSAQSVALVKKELVKFISEQVAPGDLVAIIKTSGSVGVLQQFTTDKRKLAAIIEDLKYQPATGSGLSPLAPISISFGEQIENNSGGELVGKSKAISEQRNSVESLNDINRNIQITRGSLGVLNSTIGAMSRMPGRKSVLYVAEGVYSLFSNGIGSSINALGGTPSIFLDSRELETRLRGITEFANRATIAVYTLDPRGALPVSFSASDQMRGGMTDRETGGRNDGELSARSDQLKASQQGLKFLSSETGGRAFINTNDLGKSLRETLDSQNGYYIVAYQPNTDTFDAEKRRFNKLTVKVKRPNLTVTSRSGFFNVAETAEEKSVAAPETVFLQKLFSPYKYSDVNLQLASIFAADEKSSTVRAFIGIEPKDLQFATGADGTRAAQFDVFAVAFDENGIPLSQIGKRFDIKLSAEGYEKLLTEGITSSLTFATERRGAQQIKIAVRDVNTNRVGTASQTVNVPNFGKEPLSLSGILLQNFAAEEWQNQQSGKIPANAGNAAARMQANTARRRFKKGTVLSFNYAVYAADLRSKAQAQFTVFKDGKPVFKGAAEDLNTAPNGKLQRISKGGAFLLGAEMAAGKYLLQINVSGDNLKEPAVQQIDFELVN